MVLHGCNIPSIHRQLKKVKKANGEIIGVNVVRPIISLTPSGRRNGIADYNAFFAFLVLIDIIDSREEAFESQKLWYLAPL